MKKSIEEFKTRLQTLKEEHPDGHPLLNDLQELLDSLQTSQGEVFKTSDFIKTPDGALCCDRFEDCPFFRVVYGIENISDILREYTNVYCCGPAKNRCARLVHLKCHGESLADNISPSGDDFSTYL
jgi:hypothetical protein